MNTLPGSGFIKREKAALILTAGAVVLWLVVAIFRAFPDPQGTDFYPLWLGAQAVANGGDPYSETTIELLRRTWRVKQAVQVADVIAYPLPALMLLAPLAFLSAETATYVWFGLLVASIFVFALAFADDSKILFVPLLFYPLFHALLIKTSAVFWLGLIGLLIIAIRKERFGLIGLCIALLPAKPQIGLVFALAAAVWAFNRSKAALISAALWGLVLWGGSLLLHPDWPIEWWQVIQSYRAQVLLIWLLPQGLVLPLFSHSLSWVAKIAAVQVIAFPANDLYSSLPLLVGWMEIGGWLAWLGVGCSWLATALYHNPNNPMALWLTVILPYCLMALIHTFQKRRSEQDESIADPGKKL